MENALRLDHPVIVKKTYKDLRKSPVGGSGCMNLALTDNHSELNSVSDSTKPFLWYASMKITAFDSDKPPAKDADKHIIMEAEVAIEIKAHLPSDPQEHREKIRRSISLLSAQYLAAAIKAIFTGTTFNYIQLPNLGSEIAMGTGKGSVP
ncbi:MAG: hypothetical protein KAU94_03165 [Verrucomicrobia bacterium]|nr:hypothetical protein [Verrucomicrobiota bacterium]